MLRHRHVGDALAVAILAFALLGLGGCGSAVPATQPPPVEGPGRDAGTLIFPDAGPDAGTGEVGVDGGGQTSGIRSLTVIGTTTPQVDFGEGIKLQALLLSNESGAIANEPVSFSILTGGGKLDRASVVTDQAGIARVVFTAASTREVVMVVASVDGLGERGQAEWAINVRQPDRRLRREGDISQATLKPGKSVSFGVKLTQNERPVAGARIVFSTLSARRGLLLDKQNVDSRAVTTSIDGTARIQLSMPKPADEDLEVTLLASADYAAKVDFKVIVPAYGDCESQADCLAGEVCRDGACEVKAGCGGDGDCAAGAVCADGQCVIPVGGSCASTHPDCDGVPGSYCNSSLGKCVAGCDEDEQCVAPQVCDLERNRCVAPSEVGCQEDSDCPSDLVCDGSACVPATATGCTSSDDCEWGQYCNPGLGKCVPGCDDDWQCDTRCDLASHQCAPPPECYDDGDCAGRMVCNLDGRCEMPAPIIYDLTTDWENVVQTFHVENLLPQSFLDVFVKIDNAMRIAEIVVTGNVGDLLPDVVPGFLKDRISKTVAEAIGSHLPEWLPSAVGVGSDVVKIIKDFEILSTMTFEQGPPDRSVVRGTDNWKTIVFYWYPSDCERPALGQPPAECARVEIDLAEALIAPAPSNFTGSIQSTTLTIQTHDIAFSYGKAVKVLVDRVLAHLTGHDTIEEALGSAVDCESINGWVQDVARSILADLGFESFADSIDITPQCRAQVAKATTAVTGAISGLSLTTNFALNGQVTIQQEPDNTSDYADRLVNGHWVGTLNGQAPANGKPLAGWYAERY